MNDEPAAPTLFTIGHSNSPTQEFLDLLREHRIEVLVDVRSYPRSAYAPQFNRETVKPAVEALGLRYAFFGRELSGRPDGDEFYDAEGYVRYDRVAEATFFQDGIERLARGLDRRRVAVMCSEEDPAGCHRRLLVGRVLRRQGVRIVHIRADGRTQTEEDLERAEEIAENPFGQGSLFDLPKETEWKSIRSVSPKKPPSDSSEP